MGGIRERSIWQEKEKEEERWKEKMNKFVIILFILNYIIEIS